jgi:hypothetical protein
MAANSNGMGAMKRTFSGIDPGIDMAGVKRSRFDENAFKPRKLCNYFEQGNCTKGDACTFAHGIQELDPQAQAFAAMPAAVPIGAAPDYEGGPPDHLAYENAGPPSTLTGPRTNLRPRPTQICHSWLAHPSRCSDACPLAHGLAELAPGMTASLQMVGNPPPEIVNVDRRAPLTAVRPMHVPQNRAVPRPPPFDPGMMQAPPGGEAYAPDGGSRFQGGFLPTAMCRFYLQDPSLCQKGDACTFAHGEHELLSARG